MIVLVDVEVKAIMKERQKKDNHNLSKCFTYAADTGLHEHRGWIFT